MTTPVGVRARVWLGEARVAPRKGRAKTPRSIRMVDMAGARWDAGRGLRRALGCVGALVVRSANMDQRLTRVSCGFMTTTLARLVCSHP